MLFVVLWSTGFIGAKLGLPYAEPFTFLSIRFVITLCILVPVILIFVKERASKDVILHSLVTGALVHGCYLGGVFFAISQGMSAGVSALIVALQPLLTVFLAWLVLNERISRRQIVALLVALLGVVLVISPKFINGAGAEGITAVNVGAVCLAVVGITVGSLYQKRFVPKTDLRLSTTIQYFGALAPLSLLAFMFETRQIDWTGEFLFALGWLVIVLSIGAVSLLMYLIRRNSASSTASLFYLVPVSTAIIAYFLFDEKLVPVQLIGMIVVIVAVSSAGTMANKKPRR